MKSKEIIGILNDFNQRNIVLKLENEEIINIDRNNISLIKTVFNWDSI